MTGQGVLMVVSSGLLGTASSRHLSAIAALSSRDGPVAEVIFYAHLANEEIEAQRVRVAYKCHMARK